MACVLLLLNYLFLKNIEPHKIMSKQTLKNLPDLVQKMVEGMEDLKAQDITVLDLREIENSVTDFFVISTGTSTTQVNSISEAVEKRVREDLGDKPWHIEGASEGNWVLLDYVTAVGHVFYGENRQFYDLESLWGDAEIINVPNH